MKPALAKRVAELERLADDLVYDLIGERQALPPGEAKAQARNVADKVARGLHHIRLALDRAEEG